MLNLAPPCSSLLLHLRKDVEVQVKLIFLIFPSKRAAPSKNENKHKTGNGFPPSASSLYRSCMYEAGQVRLLARLTKERYGAVAFSGQTDLFYRRTAQTHFAKRVCDPREQVMSRRTSSVVMKACRVSLALTYHPLRLLSSIFVNAYVCFPTYQLRSSLQTWMVLPFWPDVAFRWSALFKAEAKAALAVPSPLLLPLPAAGAASA